MNLVAMSPDRGAIFFRELLERVRAIPGVESASLAAKLPLAGSSSLGGINVHGVDPPNSFGFNASLNRVSDEYFRSVDLQIIQGRDFAADIDGANRVAVINEAMAARLWPAGGAVGESFFLGDVASGVSFEVIGVVENAKYRRLVEDTPNFYYLMGQRRREIGVRIALGGQPGRVVRGLMARGLIAPTAGIGIGCVLAMGFARLAGSFLGVVSPVDPLTFGSVVLLLSLAAALATFLPAARAVGAAPVAALRER